MATPSGKNKGQQQAKLPPSSGASSSSSPNATSSNYALTQFAEDKKLDLHNVSVWRMKVHTIISYHRLWDWLNEQSLDHQANLGHLHSGPDRRVGGPRHPGFHIHPLEPIRPHHEGDVRGGACPFTLEADFEAISREVICTPSHP